ncbi:hypothetical protein OTSANNIE_1224 [Anaplasma phagocytophilum str. Annie]|nr:hypothetical protein OTSANNIE_1224 [Anaplasma phagocytophilum str. Annie]
MQIAPCCRVEYRRLSAVNVTLAATLRHEVKEALNLLRDS